MKKYKISDILDSTKMPGDSYIIKFLNECKEYSRKENINSILRQNSKKIFCYEYEFYGVTYISFPLELIKKILNLSDKSLINTKQTTKFISDVSGVSSTKSNYKFFELNNFKFGQGDVRLKQELVCLAVAFFFCFPQKTIYNFHEYIKHCKDQKQIDPDTPPNFKAAGNAELSFSANKYQKFATILNIKYIIDSVGVAKTLIANKTKLKLSTPLNKYKIVEEKHKLAKELKDNPFRKIVKPVGYYANPDKLMIADIFLIDTSSEKYYVKNLKVFNSSNLQHDQYRKFMDESFRNGAIIPISLKQLTPATLSENLTTSRIKIVGSYTKEDQNNVDKDFIDEYMDAAIKLFSQRNMKQFVDTMNKMIDINISTTSFKTSGKNTEIDFITNFKLTNKSKDKKIYRIWMSGGSIYTKPQKPKTTSPAGLGGISSNFLVEKIIEKLPRNNQFFNKLNAARINVFGEENFDDLFKSNEIINLDRMKKYLNNKTKNEQVLLLSNYAQALKKNMAQNAPKLDLQGFRRLSVNEIPQKMLHFEMMSYIIAHKQIISEWIKNSFIMSMYGAASGSGSIIFDGKNIKLGNFGRQGMKKHAILNPMYLKIGF